MSTSGSVTFATNRDQIITEAYRKIGMISDTETAPSTAQVTIAAYNLNMLVKALQADGMPLWALKESSLTMTATSTYTVGTGKTFNIPRSLRIIDARIHNATTNSDIPLTIVTREEYDRLGNKTSTGTPSQVYYDPQLLANNPTLYVFPFPDAYTIANCTLVIVYQRPFEDFNASTDEPDFPQEWYLAVVYLLALILAPNSGITLDERQMLRAEADIFHQMALSAGVEEGSIYFEPNKWGMGTDNG